MNTPPASASFDPVADGVRFTLRYDPPAGVQRRGTVILAPAFAEEMNRCRRMTALCSRRLAQAGWRVIVRDLRGCGDSSGEFGEAAWEDWIEDLERLLVEVPRSEPLWLWGVRAGALLLPRLLAERPDANVLLWQPAMAGRTALTQFLRVKVAAAAIGGKERVDAKGLRATLQAGQPIEIAGYAISPPLATGMDGAVFDLPTAFTGRLVWLEVAAIAPASLAPAGTEIRSRWLAQHVRCDAEAVAGEAFWQTQEVSECAALIDATLTHVADGGAQPSAALRQDVHGVRPGLAGPLQEVERA